MNNSPKVVFVSHPYFAINNKDNNYRFYKWNKNGKRIYKQCKNRNHYRQEITKYICGDNGFFNYGRDEKKSNVSIETFVEENISMFEYFRGANKDKSYLNLNAMLRDKMMMLKNGKYATDDDAKILKRRWQKYIENSNVYLSVLSFNSDYVDHNINVDDLHKIITTKVIPKFLKRCGYENINKNMDWTVAFHSAIDRNNYHFHIGFVERKPSYLTNTNQFTYKQRLNLTDDEINFIKRQTIIEIEREKIFSPAIKKLNLSLEEFKKYFDPSEKNFTLRNHHYLDMEIKIIRLGYLLNKVRSNDKRIKYNSLPKNEIGKEIRYLTNEIKNELLNNKEINYSKKEINENINHINEIFDKIDCDNNIKKSDISTIDLIEKKIKKYDNYVLNAIVNHSLYVYNRTTSNSNIKLNDLINEIVINNYRKQNKNNLYKKKILKDYFDNNIFKNYSAVNNAFRKLKYEQDKVAEQFYEMFKESNYEK